MRQGRSVITAIGALLSLALFAAACASGADTGEVSARSGRYGASLETSTTVPSLEDIGLSGGTGANGKREQATENLLNALSENPELLNNLDNLTPDQLEELTGLSSEELGTLGITPATVGALGGVINKIGGGEQDSLSPETAAILAAGGGALLNGSGALTAEGAALLASLNIDPATFAVLIATALTVPTSVTEPLGALLLILDPNGLGQFSGDNSSLAVIAVLMGAVLGRDPVALAQLQNAEDINPAFKGVILFIANLATTLSPEFIDRINNISRILGPYAIRAIGTALALLERPQVGAIFESAFSDPLVVADAFGAALLFIPGLAAAGRAQHLQRSVLDLFGRVGSVRDRTSERRRSRIPRLPGGDRCGAPPGVPVRSRGQDT